MRYQGQAWRPHISKRLDVGQTCAIFVAEVYKLGSQVSGFRTQVSGMLLGRACSVRLVLI